MPLTFAQGAIEHVSIDGLPVEVLRFNGETVFEAAFDVTHTMAVGNYETFELRDYLLSLGWDGVRKLKGTITVPAGVGWHASSTSTFGAYIRDLPAGDFTIEFHGEIRGAGGAGGDAWHNGASAGNPGGDALYVAPDLGATVRFDNKGTIAGGGGGGGGAFYGNNHASGGGGAGWPAGAAGTISSSLGVRGASGTATAGGAGGNRADYKGTPIAWAGAGGAPGMAGGVGLYGAARAGGAAGRSVVGANRLIWIDTGSRLGPVVDN